MSSNQPYLTELTWVPFRRIIDELADALGLRKILSLRLISSMRIIHAISFNTDSAREV